MSLVWIDPVPLVRYRDEGIISGRARHTVVIQGGFVHARYSTAREAKAAVRRITSATLEKRSKDR